ncbi:hypothetical protein HAX54_037516, partial [Datura stramonium]|nr:hypothetical protein [Datura stramonium]
EGVAGCGQAASSGFCILSRSKIKVIRNYTDGASHGIRTLLRWVLVIGASFILNPTPWPHDLLENQV